MDIDLGKLPAILNKYPRRESSLIMLLQDIQAEFNYLPGEALMEVSKALGIPYARVLGVATFYKAFSLRPRGRKTVRLCTGTVCHVRGAPLLKDEISRTLGVALPGTTEDLEFTVELVNCVGACAMAPVVMVEEDYHANVRPDQVKKVLGLKKKTGAENLEEEEVE